MDATIQNVDALCENFIKYISKSELMGRTQLCETLRVFQQNRNGLQSIEYFLQQRPFESCCINFVGSELCIPVCLAWPHKSYLESSALISTNVYCNKWCDLLRKQVELKLVASLNCSEWQNRESSLWFKCSTIFKEIEK